MLYLLIIFSVVTITLMFFANKEFINNVRSVVEEVKKVSAGSEACENATNAVAIEIPNVKIKEGNKLRVLSKRDNYLKLFVEGNSMKKFGISDNSLLYVKKTQDLHNIIGKKFIVLKYDNETKKHKDNKIEYKLRKYMFSYNTSMDFQTWVNTLELDTERKNKLIEKYDVKKQENFFAENTTYIVSETTTKIGTEYIENIPCFSFHKYDKLVGYVDFVVMEKINVIDENINISTKQVA